jgi:hypothetical protein
VRGLVCAADFFTPSKPYRRSSRLSGSPKTGALPHGGRRRRGRGRCEIERASPIFQALKPYRTADGVAAEASRSPDPDLSKLQTSGSPKTWSLDSLYADWFPSLHLTPGAAAGGTGTTIPSRSAATLWASRTSISSGASISTSTTITITVTVTRA